MCMLRVARSPSRAAVPAAPRVYKPRRSTRAVPPSVRQSCRPRPAPPPARDLGFDRAFHQYVLRSIARALKARVVAQAARSQRQRGAAAPVPAAVSPGRCVCCRHCRRGARRRSQPQCATCGRHFKSSWRCPPASSGATPAGPSTTVPTSLQPSSVRRRCALHPATS